MNLEKTLAGVLGKYASRKFMVAVGAVVYLLVQQDYVSAAIPAAAYVIGQALVDAFSGFAPKSQ